MFDSKEGEESDAPNDPNEENENNCNQILKIFYANINGLNDNKIQQTDMMKDINNSDIICFTETHLSKDEEHPEIEDYLSYHTCADKKSILSRNIKGVSCLLYTSPSPRDGLLSRMPSSA